jgi:hypothetical protein
MTDQNPRRFCPRTTAEPSQANSAVVSADAAVLCDGAVFSTACRSRHRRTRLEDVGRWAARLHVWTLYVHCTGEHAAVRSGTSERTAPTGESMACPSRRPRAPSRTSRAC